MTDKSMISPVLLGDIEGKQINLELTLNILNNFNAGKYDHVETVSVTGLPQVDGRSIVSLDGEVSLTLPYELCVNRLTCSGWQGNVERFGKKDGEGITFSRSGLYVLGISLLPLLAYGVLNGGSATSFHDRKKNIDFNAALFSIYRSLFEKNSEKYRGTPKGLTPAFYHPDGSEGPTFLELKMRNLLIRTMEYQELARAMGLRNSSMTLHPMFQMTSIKTNDEIKAALSSFSKSPFLEDLMAATNNSIVNVLTGIQPLLAAYTHSKEGVPKKLFTRAHGKENSVLPLPGGHGQNFTVLKAIYQDLYDQGKRFIYLGNIDNLGFTIHPEALALLALSGKQAGFDFSFKTPVDVKGGILVYDQRKRLNCADIGPAIPEEEVLKAERQGKPIMFNCATGLFSLDYLVRNLDVIINELPVRFSDQNKDAGRYSQAEQVTWEIIGMLDDFYVFGVDKFERFLSAKLVLETFMTSGLEFDHPDFPSSRNPKHDLRGIAGRLYSGLSKKLSRDYGMRLYNGRWKPLSIGNLKQA